MNDALFRLQPTKAEVEAIKRGIQAFTDRLVRDPKRAEKLLERIGASQTGEKS